GKAAVMPRPRVERPRVAQDGEIVDGYYHRDPALPRGAEGRAVEDVQRLRLARQPAGVPPRVPDDRRELPVTPERELLVLVVGEQAADVPRRPGLRLEERRHVEPYAHHVSSMTRPVRAQVNGAACASPRGTS